MMERVMAFHLIGQGQVFYEPLSTYDQLLALTYINERLLRGGASAAVYNNLEISFQTFDSIFSAPAGWVPMPETDEPERGVHAVALGNEYVTRPVEALRFQNSWGSRWGDEGCGWLSRQYLHRYMVDAWRWRDVQVGPSRFTRMRLAEAVTNEDFAKVWMTENPRRETDFVYTGSSHTLHIYEALSVSGNPVEVIEIRNRLGLRLGWAHLHHISSELSRISVLKELFVWPAFRRQGYATLLESVASQRAKQWHSANIRIYFYEPDAAPRNRQAGQFFTLKLGYTLDWRQERLPNLAAVGEKRL